MTIISIIGSGGHTRSSLNLLKNKFSGSVFKIYDDSYDSKLEEYISDIKIYGNVCEVDKSSNVFLSVGDNNKREELYNNFINIVIKENIFHSRSFCEKNILIGCSNQIYANVYLNSLVNIGNNNIINTGAIIEHETIIGSHNHISVGVRICGRVNIGSRCFIGAGSIIIDNIYICDDVIIGAGSVVIKNIYKPGTYVGNPARMVK